MEDSTLPNIGTSFKKWDGCRCTSPPPQRSPGPCYMQGPEKIKLKKVIKKI
jgi:hypothetical protein